MASRERRYIRTIRAVEDLLLECLAQPTAENMRRIEEIGERFPELDKLHVGHKVFLRKPVPADPCIVFIESFASVRESVPESIAVYLVSSEEIREGQAGLQKIYHRRLEDL